MPEQETQLPESQQALDQDNPEGTEMPKPVAVAVPEQETQLPQSQQAVDQEMGSAETPKPVPVTEQETQLPESQQAVDQEMGTETPKPVPVPKQETQLPESQLAVAMKTEPSEHMHTEASASHVPSANPAIHACLRRPDTCDFATGATPSGPNTRVLLDVNGVMQVVSLRMTKEAAIQAGLSIVEDVKPAPPAKVAFQPHEAPAAATTSTETALSAAVQAAATDTDREASEAEDEQTQAAKKKPSSELTPQARPA